MSVNPKTIRCSVVQPSLSSCWLRHDVGMKTDVMFNLEGNYSADLNYPDKSNQNVNFQTRFSQIGLKLDKK